MKKLRKKNQQFQSMFDRLPLMKKLFNLMAWLKKKNLGTFKQKNEKKLFLIRWFKWKNQDMINRRQYFYLIADFYNKRIG